MLTLDIPPLMTVTEIVFAKRGTVNHNAKTVWSGTNEVPEGYAVQNHVLKKTLLLSGISPDIPTHDDRRKMTGNLGDGFARITLVAPETD